MSIARHIGFGFDLVKAHITDKNVPFLVQFSITNRCNLKCLYCYADYPDRPEKDLSYEQITNIIDQLADLGTRRINIVGGEPLIRKDIGDIVAHIKKRGLECTMTTNGFFVPYKVEVVKQLDLLCISLDGKKEGNDLQRGQGVHDKVIKALETATAEGVICQISCVLTKATMDSVDYMVELGKRFNAKVAFTTLIKPVEGTTSYDNLIPTDDECRNALRRIIQLKEGGAPILFSYDTLKHALHWPKSYSEDRMFEEPDFDYPECYAGRFFLIIDVNGDVYRCPQMVDRAKKINCMEHGVKKALQILAEDKACKTCHIPCSNELSSYFGMKPNVIFNYITTYTSKVKANKDSFVGNKTPAVQEPTIQATQ
jgi:MoaA/NifB/PqqE/SkfB family radical SAM enzyme